MQMTGCHIEDGRMIAWVALPNGTPTAWQFCMADHSGCKTPPRVVEAYKEFCAAVQDAVVLQMIESIPAAPDSPPSILLIKPCRVCDAKTIDNADDARGFTFCPAHRSYAQS